MEKKTGFWNNNKSLVMIGGITIVSLITGVIGCQLYDERIELKKEGNAILKILSEHLDE